MVIECRGSSGSLHAATGARCLSRAELHGSNPTRVELGRVEHAPAGREPEAATSAAARAHRDHRRALRARPCAMLLLPAAPYEACEKITGRVSSLSLVRYRSNDYSVPTQYGHRQVWVKGYMREMVSGGSGAGFRRGHARGFGAGRTERPGYSCMASRWRSTSLATSLRVISFFSPSWQAGWQDRMLHLQMVSSMP